MLVAQGIFTQAVYLLFRYCHGLVLVLNAQPFLPLHHDRFTTVFSHVQLQFFLHRNRYVLFVPVAKASILTILLLPLNTQTFLPLANKSFAIQHDNKTVFELQEYRDKGKQTLIENTGFEFATQNPETMQKIKDSSLKNNGGMGFASEKVLKTKNKQVKADAFASAFCL